MYEGTESAKINRAADAMTMKTRVWIKRITPLEGEEFRFRVYPDDPENPNAIWIESGNEEDLKIFTDSVKVMGLTT